MKAVNIAGFTMYQVREDGIYSIHSGTWVKLAEIFDKSCGYYIVTLAEGGVRKNKRVHRLLAEAFVPNPHKKAHVNHLNGNKLDNRLINFEWATPQENSQHAVTLGLCEAAYAAKRTPIAQYTKDRKQLIKQHCSQQEASRETGVAVQNISKVLRGIRPHAGGYHWEYI